MLEATLSSPPGRGDMEKTRAGSGGDEKGLGAMENDIGKEDGEWSADGRRPVMLYAPFISGLAIILNCVFVSSGMRNLIKEALLDSDYSRFALMATVPFGFLLATVSPDIFASESRILTLDAANTVLLYLCCWQRLADVWPHRSFPREQRILFWQSAVTNVRHITSNHHYDARLQGELDPIYAKLASHDLVRSILEFRKGLKVSSFLLSNL